MTAPTFVMDKSLRRFHREIFYAAFGFGPFECYFCHEPVLFGKAVVHHLDENARNNHPLNLVPAHRGCHNTWHGQMRGYWPRDKPAEQRYVPSIETRAKISAANKGRPKSAEHRRRMSEGAKRRWEREKAQGKRSPVG